MRQAQRFVGVSVLALAALAVSSGTAGARPLVAGSPRYYVSSQTPPTAEQCARARPGAACYSPTQLQTAYDLPGLYARGITGKGQTIAIVDSFGSPTIQQDLDHFDAAFGLPAPPSLKTIAPAGALPPFDANNPDMVGWAEETTLDVEYAHAMAPQAKILVVATPTSETEGVQGFPEIVAAENYVVDHQLGDVISQSFGATEETFPTKGSLLALRSAFENARAHDVTVLGGTSDSGSTDYELNLQDVFRHRVVDWPASDPLVTAMGGTQLHLDAQGRRTAPDNVWNDVAFGVPAAGGGGRSHVFARPDFQRRVRTGSGHRRGLPDLSMSAAVNGGVVVYLSIPGDQTGYYVFGGTSEATPLFSGIVSLADQLAGQRLGWINPRLYQLDRQPVSGIVDITLGDNTYSEPGPDGTPLFTVRGFSAKPGYDLASGLGTIDGPRFAEALADKDDEPQG